MTGLPGHPRRFFLLPLVIALLVAGWAGELRAQAHASPGVDGRDSAAAWLDPAASRLFFAPTGRMLPRGEAQLGTYFILPFATYAFTDRFMVSGGTPLHPALIGRAWYLAPKLGLYAGERFSVAAGGLILGQIRHGYGDQPTGVGPFEWDSPPPLLWLVSTLGTEDRSASLGVATTLSNPLGVWELRAPEVIIGGGEWLLVRRFAEDGTVDRAAKLIGEVFMPAPVRSGASLDGSIGAFGIRVLNGRTTLEVVAVASLVRQEEWVTPPRSGDGELRRWYRLNFLPVPMLSVSHRL